VVESLSESTSGRDSKWKYKKPDPLKFTHTHILTHIPRNTMLTELTYLSMCVVRVCVRTYACLCACVCVCV